MISGSGTETEAVVGELQGCMTIRSPGLLGIGHFVHFVMFATQAGSP